MRGEDALDCGHDRVEVGETARALVAARESPDLGIDDLDTAVAQQGDVVLHRGVLPHLRVHRRAHHDGSARRQQGRRQEVVRDAVGVGADHPRRRRRHDDDVGALAQPRVRNRVRPVPQRGLRGLGGQRRERHRAHEPRGVGGEDRGNVRTGVDQPAHGPVLQKPRKTRRNSGIKATYFVGHQQA